MQLLALLAPVAALLLSLLLAVVVSYAVIYAGLWSLFNRRRPTRAKTGPDAQHSVIKSFSMHGLQIEDQSSK
jgi:hypothetical protein